MAHGSPPFAVLHIFAGIIDGLDVPTRDHDLCYIFASKLTSLMDKADPSLPINPFVCIFVNYDLN